MPIKGLSALKNLGKIKKIHIFSGDRRAGILGNGHDDICVGDFTGDRRAEILSSGYIFLRSTCG
ncbi:MAG: hypothetical protein HC799_03310 [Limnothrix sp. RL_2_0]|nr:hypothetical protein [Limnothrix sp. RL_2_0]